MNTMFGLDVLSAAVGMTVTEIEQINSKTTQTLFSMIFCPSTLVFCPINTLPLVGSATVLKSRHDDESMP